MRRHPKARRERSGNPPESRSSARTPVEHVSVPQKLSAGRTQSSSGAALPDGRRLSALSPADCSDQYRRTRELMKSWTSVSKRQLGERQKLSYRDVGWALLPVRTSDFKPGRARVPVLQGHFFLPLTLTKTLPTLLATEEDSMIPTLRIAYEILAGQKRGTSGRDESSRNRPCTTQLESFQRVGNLGRSSRRKLKLLCATLTNTRRRRADRSR